MADTLKERKIYRILTNASSKAWDKIAFWTTAKSVDAADGNNLETKVGAIKGITTSTSTTTTGYAADATVIKTLNDSLGKVRTYVGSDGKLHFVNASGADTALNFSSFKRYYVGNVQLSTSAKKYEVGFRPSFIMVGILNANGVFWYDKTLNKCIYNGHTNQSVDVGTWFRTGDESNMGLFNIISIDNTGFTLQTYTTNNAFILAFQY